MKIVLIYIYIFHNKIQKKEEEEEEREKKWREKRKKMFIWSLFLFSVRLNYFVGEQLADEEIGDESELVVEWSDDCDGELVDGGGYNR